MKTAVMKPSSMAGNEDKLFLKIQDQERPIYKIRTIKLFKSISFEQKKMGG
jgi:hypothetical protein